MSEIISENILMIEAISLDLAGQVTAWIRDKYRVTFELRASIIKSKSKLCIIVTLQIIGCIMLVFSI